MVCSIISFSRPKQTEFTLHARYKLQCQLSPCIQAHELESNAVAAIHKFSRCNACNKRLNRFLFIYWIASCVQVCIDFGKCSHDVCRRHYACISASHSNRYFIHILNKNFKISSLLDVGIFHIDVCFFVVFFIFASHKLLAVTFMHIDMFIL